jgi:hypothetical protein
MKPALKKNLNEVLATAKKEGFEKEIIQNYQQMIKRIEITKNSEIDNKKRGDCKYYYR